MAHPLYHTYPFSSIASYWGNPYGFFFPRRGGWGFGYGYGCYFCYHPMFYSTPLTWAYGPFGGFYNGYLGVIADPHTLAVVDGGEGPEEVNEEDLFGDMD